MLKFLEEQFEPKANWQRRMTDVILGVLVPLPYLWLGTFGGITLFTCVLIGFGVLANALWLVSGPRLKFLSGFFVGAMVIATVATFTFGTFSFLFSMILCLLLPIVIVMSESGSSLPMWWVLFLPPLGFMPYVIGIVFMRNSQDAFHHAKQWMSQSQLASSIILTVVSIFLVALVTSRSPSLN